MVGDEPVHYRLFSVLIFLLCLPLIFLLARELLHSSLAGWVGSSLFAVSSFVQLYAQEARYYLLWVFTFLLCNYALLKAVKENRRLWWAAYAVSAVLALYTSLLSGLFLLGHALFLWCYRRNCLAAFIFSAGMAVLLYSPWLYFLYSSHDSIDEGLSWQLDKTDAFSAPELLLWQVIGFLKYFSFLFRLKEYDSLWNGTALSWLYLSGLADIMLVALLIYAVYYLIKKAPRETTWFMLLLLLPQYLLFFFSDIVRDSHTSYLIRYQITGMTGMSLVVTYLFSQKMAKGSSWFAAVFITVVVLSVISIFEMKANRCWTTRLDCEINISTASLLSSATHPLVITDFGRKPENFLVVLNTAQNKNLDVLYTDNSAQRATTIVEQGNYDRVYVVQASDILLRNLQQRFKGRLQLCVAEKSKMLRVWEISKTPDKPYRAAPSPQGSV